MAKGTAFEEDVCWRRGSPYRLLFISNVRLWIQGPHLVQHLHSTQQTQQKLPAEPDTVEGH